MTQRKGYKNNNIRIGKLMLASEFMIFAQGGRHVTAVVYLSVASQAEWSSLCLRIAAGCIQLANYRLFPGDQLQDLMKSVQLCQKLEWTFG